MPKQSAGILMYRYQDKELQVFLVHPGGPLWVNRDSGSWSIPKGEFSPEEDALMAAKREFQEETSFQVDGKFIPLTPMMQSSGKLVHAWAVEGDCEPSAIKSNTFSMEWPPRSGKYQEFPEVDRAEWFTIETAKAKILQGQRQFLDELIRILGR